MTKTKYLRQKRRLIENLKHIYENCLYEVIPLSITCRKVNFFFGQEARHDYALFLSSWHDPTTSLEDNPEIVIPRQLRGRELHYLEVITSHVPTKFHGRSRNNKNI